MPQATYTKLRNIHDGNGSDSGPGCPFFPFTAGLIGSQPGRRERNGLVRVIQTHDKRQWLLSAAGGNVGVASGAAAMQQGANTTKRGQLLLVGEDNPSCFVGSSHLSQVWCTVLYGLYPQPHQADVCTAVPLLSPQPIRSDRQGLAHPHPSTQRRSIRLGCCQADSAMCAWWLAACPSMQCMWQ